MKLRILPLTILLMAMLASSALAADPGPAADRWPVLPVADVELRTSDALDLDLLAAEDLRREAEGLPWRFAEPEDVQLTPDNSGTWESLPDGRGLWRMRLAGPGALSMNLGFTRFYLPGDAVLRIYAVDRPGDSQAYDRSDNADHGQLWTPVVIGNEIVVEVEIDPRDRNDLGLELTRINRGYRYFGEDLGEKSGYCNVDVVCPEGDDWRDQIDTVGMISINGFEKCTGFMVNNTALDSRPLFVTAAHCALGPLNEQTLVVYWNYQSPTCGQPGGGSKLDAQTGSTWLATMLDSDFTIVELDEQPDPDWGVKFAGWNRGAAPPTSAVGIHHPSTDEKSISFENDPLTITSYYDQVPINETHFKVADWDLGTTEGGSSGSPLFDQDGYVVGELHGGDAACGNNSPDWYGRLAYAWDEGSDAASRLRDWLDPVGTGQTTLELYDPEVASYLVTPLDDFEASGTVGESFEPATMTYTLQNPGTLAAPFEIRTQVINLVTVTPNSGIIPVGGQVQVQVEWASSVTGLTVGTYSDTLRFLVNETREPMATLAAVLTVEPGAPETIGPIPNPFSTYTEIQFHLEEAGTARARVLDINGRLLNDLGTKSFPAGLNRWGWGGDDGAGRRMPSGLYVFELEAGGQTQRFRVTHVH